MASFSQATPPSARYLLEIAAWVAAMSSKPLEPPTPYQDILATAPTEIEQVHNSELNKSFNLGAYQDRQNARKHKTIAFVTSLVLIVALIVLCKVLRGILQDSRDTVVDSMTPLSLQLITHNIRNDNRNPEEGERFWEDRRKLVTSSLKFHTQQAAASVIGLQEVLYNQLEDILELLNDGNDEADWTYYGIGRTDGVKAGEFAPIIYKQSQWELIGNRTFWLSETPDVPSIGWDSVMERIVTMVTLRSRAAPSHTINVFCTHFDHRGVQGRAESAKLIIDRMENYNDYPSFLLGDFNTQPRDPPYQILKKHGIKDSRTLATAGQTYGHAATFTGFDKAHEVNTIIDYIWAPSWATNSLAPADAATTAAAASGRTKTTIALTSFGVLHSHFGFYLSDHRPVLATYNLQK
jgi:endonuclease/exonuclease/phosphatase family metal-dependent hydrolase